MPGRHHRIWPQAVANVGEMIARGAIVRMACRSCHNIFDVDLLLVAHMRGRAKSLVDVHPQCRLSGCRGDARFLYSAAPAEPFLYLSSEPAPAWLKGLRPIDVDAPDTPPQFPPPVAARLERRAAG